MAAFDFDFSNPFEKVTSEQIDSMAEEIINEALPVVKENMKQTLSSHKDTGDLIDSVSIRKAKKSKGGGYSGSVYFKGYDRNGHPNNVKAAALQYGNRQGAKHSTNGGKGQKASPFLEAVKVKSEREVQKIGETIVAKRMGGES